MTIIPIATQTPMKDYIGQEGCYFYWTSFTIISYELVVGGFVMAIFRVCCIHNLLPQNIPMKTVTVRFMMVQGAILTSMTVMSLIGKQ